MATLVCRLASLIVLALGLSVAAAAQCAYQIADLTASDAQVADAFGHAVAIDGDVMVAGANMVGAAVGAAYVYRFDGASWREEQELVPDDLATGDEFGMSVAVAGDVIVVGCWRDDHSSLTNPGSAYVYRWLSGVWTLEQKLTASDAAANDQFGVSVSASGAVIVVGAWYDDHAGLTDAGSAYVFRHDGSAWREEQKLTASDAASGDWYGFAVAVDGPVIVVGARNGDGPAAACGLAYVYRHGSSAWSQEQELIASDAAFGDQFGLAVAVHADTVAVGAPFKDGQAGAAYVFRHDGAHWNEAARLVPTGLHAGAGFGASVCVRDDLVVAGWPSADLAAESAGAVSLFRYAAGAWSVWATVLAKDAAAGDSLGYSVSASDAMVVAGAPDHEHGLNESGAVLVYSLGGAPATAGSYGQGWPGTIGVPSLTAERAPVLGSTLPLELANSYGASTLAVLLVGRQRASFPTPWDGTLLVGPRTPAMLHSFLRLAAGTTVLSLAIPSDPALRGKTFTLQALELDPGASKGLSFTPGLELVLGDC